MTPEESKAKDIEDALKEHDAKRRADAEAGEKLDTVLTNLDSFAKGLDSLCKRMDALEAEKKKADDDGDEETAKSYPPVGMNPLNRGEDPDAPRPLGADSARADSIRADSEEIEHFKKENGATRTIAADSVLAAIQSDADRASTAWGKSAPTPWTSEGIAAYRRRTAHDHQQHSPAWKDVDLRTLSGQALRNAAREIFADSISASSSPETYGETLREVCRRDPETGHLIKEYYGEPRAWMQHFSGGPPRLARFNLDKRSAARERERVRNELFVRYDNFSELFKSAEPDLEEFVFDLLLKIMRASYELGIHAAPDGRAARAARQGSVDSKFINLVSIVNIYCREHGLEPKASEKFARVIRPDILELFCKPKDAPSKIHPSLSGIVKALRSVRKSSFTL